jgi:hypothetical protein
MKLLGAAAVLAAGTGAWADDPGKVSKPVVTVCIKPGANPTILYRGQGAATQLLKQADVRIEWRNDERACAAAEHGIVVSVSLATPENLHPGALAYALPFERTRIVLFYDRVLNTLGPAGVPNLLGHVLAHEIVHILQGVDQHSAGGIMKARWDARDYAEMQRGRLRFTGEDIALIHRGLDRRASM